MNDTLCNIIHLTHTLFNIIYLTQYQTYHIVFIHTVCYRGILVLKYALILQDKAMFQVNVAAIILNVLYIICFHIYCNTKWQDLYKPTSIGTGLTAAIFGYLEMEDPELIEYRYGLLITILSFILMGSPLFEVVCFECRF